MPCEHLSKREPLNAGLGLSGKCSQRSPRTTNLLLVDFERVAIGHLELRQKLARYSIAFTPTRYAYCIWGVRRVDTLTVEEEAHAVGSLSLTLAEGVHELLELGGTLDLEEDFVVVVRHLNVEMLGLLLLILRLLRAWGSVAFRHVA